MPRFLVTAKQFVEEIGEREIEANNADEAIAEADENDDWDWSDGDEVKEFEVIGAKEIHDDDDDEEDEPEDEEDPKE
jgi:hypothetical protein